MIGRGWSGKREWDGRGDVGSGMNEMRGMEMEGEGSGGESMEGKG